MPKKNKCCEKLFHAEEKNPVVKPAPKPGKMGKEIDEIFSRKKRKQPEPEKPADGVKGDKKGETKAVLMSDKKKKKNADMKRRRNGEGESSSAVASTRARKRTDDGLAIYTEDELGINNAKAGGTPLCPFDCDCCF